MPTMKDVAKHAGVSISTVSNIVNKSKSVNSSIVKKVEEAMFELGYSPNTSAQGLRGKKSNLFGVLVPDVTDSIYADYLRGIEEIARTQNYRIEVYATGDLPDLEADALSKLYSQKVEVVFITTCSKSNTDLIEYYTEKGMKFIYFRRKPANLRNFIYVGADEYSTVYNTISKLALEGVKSMSLIVLSSSFSNELSCRRAFEDACSEFLIEIINVVHTHMGKERAFRRVSNWIHNDEMPEVILTTSAKLAEGGQAAIDFFSYEKNTRIKFIKGFSWTQLFSGIEKTSMLENYYLAGIKACQKAFEIADKEDEIEPCNIIVPTKKELCANSFSTNLTLEKAVLKILLIKGSHADALKLVSHKFVTEQGVQIEVDTTSYEMLYKNLEENLQNYDVIQTEQSTISKLAFDKKIMPLSDTVVSRKIKGYFSPEILDIYSTNNNELYCVPFTVDSQLLFYRKDIFENTHLKRLFFEHHRKEFFPPSTWKEYALIAKFLTKVSNEFSPVEYGVSFSGDYDEVSHEFISMLWEVASSAKINSEQISKKQVIKTLNLLKSVYVCSHKEAIDFTDEQKIELFNSGNAAMMVLYRGKYFDFSNSSKINISINEKTFSMTPPGLSSIRGGWSLAVSAKSKNTRLAASFLSWYITDQVAIPNNVLGGSMPNLAAMNNSELFLVSSWIELCCETVKNSEPMYSDLLNNFGYEINEKLGSILCEFLRGNIDENLAHEKIAGVLKSTN